MSNRIVIIACLLAVLLAGAAALLLRTPPPTAPAPAPLLDLDPAKVSRIAITDAAGATHTFLRAADGGWSWMPAADPDPARAWPAEPRFPRALLDALDSTPRTPATTSEPAPADAIRIHLTFFDGATAHAAFAPRPVGGQGRAWLRSNAPGDGTPADEGPFLIPIAVLDAATIPPPPEWRAKDALPGITQFTIRAVRLTTATTSLELSRQDNRWYLDEPVEARADQAAITQLLSALASLETDRFLDAPDPAIITAAGFDAPTLSISITPTTPRDPTPGTSAPPTRPSPITLTLGGPTADGSALLARAGGATGGAGGFDGLLAIPRDQVAEINTDPAAYLAKTATGVAPADVNTIIIVRPGGASRYTRAQDLWVRDAADSSGGEPPPPPPAPSPLARDEAAAILKLLAETPGTPRLTDPIDPDGGAATLATIDLLGFDGGTLDTIELAILEDGSPVAVLNGVLVTYAATDLPAVLGGAAR